MGNTNSSNDKKQIDAKKEEKQKQQSDNNSKLGRSAPEKGFNMSCMAIGGYYAGLQFYSDAITCQRDLPTDSVPCPSDISQASNNSNTIFNQKSFKERGNDESSANTSKHALN